MQFSHIPFEGHSTARVEIQKITWRKQFHMFAIVNLDTDNWKSACNIEEMQVWIRRKIISVCSFQQTWSFKYQIEGIHTPVI